MRPLLTALLTALFALCLAVPAAAHRQPEVETTVEVVAAEGGDVLHLTTRLHAHDALRALRALGLDQPRLEEPEHRARLALYVRDRLGLAGEGITEVVGAETEGNYVFVYLIHPELAAVTGSSVLADVAPGWSNTVHLREDGETVRSATFTADHPHAAEPVLPASTAGQRAAR